MSEQRIYSDNLKSLVVDCAICRDNSKMKGTGYLINSEISKGWVVEFECTKTKEIIRKWNIKFNKYIRDILLSNNIDSSSYKEE